MSAPASCETGRYTIPHDKVSLKEREYPNPVIESGNGLTESKAIRPSGIPMPSPSASVFVLLLFVTDVVALLASGWTAAAASLVA